MIYCITRRLEFDSGHRVALHQSKCRNPHGHRYVAEIECSAETLDKMGFVIDFGVVKQIVGEWIDERWDHTTLYEASDTFMKTVAGQAEAEGLKPFYEMSNSPTAENIARELYGVAQMLLSKHPITVERVTIWETPNCRATYPGSTT